MKSLTISPIRKTKFKMKLYGFYSEKQAAVGGCGLFRTSTGQVVKVSETTTTGKPAGFWDDYVSFGELCECIESNFNVPSLKKGAVKKNNNGGEIDFLDYLDAPELLVNDLAFVMNLGEDKSFAKLAMLEGYVFLYHSCHIPSENPAAKLYSVLMKIGFTKEQVAKEILKQDKVRKSNPKLLVN